MVGRACREPKPSCSVPDSPRRASPSRPRPRSGPDEQKEVSVKIRVLAALPQEVAQQLCVCSCHRYGPGKKKKRRKMSHALKQVFNKDKTFRPKRKFEPGTQRFELHKKAQASLNAGLDLKVAVQLPPGEEQNDWVAVHVVDFFNRINLIYGTISDYCTEQSCPVMSGGPKYEYRWQDEHKYRKPTALSAPQYMNLLMDWIEVQINNEDIFPTNVGTPFPKNFLPVVKKILSRLFRVFVHVYIHHFDRITQMGSEAHVNTCYKHFYYFVKEFNLIDTKELEPLKEMTSRMCH
ncbi:MOB kinase activator 3A isoform X1 [Anser cygnoides]|uniref:MOB kinase activator 3A isoform X1 n=1 Tax=Anser cygnoides TaxID=8845 RepID=UPI0034D38B8D